MPASQTFPMGRPRLAGGINISGVLRASETVNDSPIELKEKAYQHFAAGEYSKALAALVAIESLTGVHSSLANDLAVAHYRMGLYPQAMERFRQALQLQGEGDHLIANNLLDIVEELLSTKRDGSTVPPVQAPLPEGTNSWCPLCGAVDRGFLPLPDTYRQQAERHGFVHFGKGEMTALATYSCQKCGASDRERLYTYWLKQGVEAGRILPQAKVVHFAPEPSFSAWLKGFGFRSYETADMMMKGVDHQVDLMDLPFADKSFDLFICSHVLEHVDDDQKAIRELSRITRMGGCGILMAPVMPHLEQSVEDPTAQGAAERWRLFGQGDHVRLYSHQDYVSRLSGNGFTVHQLGVDHFGERAFAAMGLKHSSVLYIVEPVS